MNAVKSIGRILGSVLVITITAAVAATPILVAFAAIKYVVS